MLVPTETKSFQNLDVEGSLKPREDKLSSCRDVRDNQFVLNWGKLGLIGT